MSWVVYSRNSRFRINRSPPSDTDGQLKTQINNTDLLFPPFLSQGNVINELDSRDERRGNGWRWEKPRGEPGCGARCVWMNATSTAWRVFVSMKRERMLEDLHSSFPPPPSLYFLINGMETEGFPEGNTLIAGYRMLLKKDLERLIFPSSLANKIHFPSIPIMGRKLRFISTWTVL